MFDRRDVRMHPKTKRVLLDLLPPGLLRWAKGGIDLVRPARFEFVGTKWPATSTPTAGWDTEGVARAREQSWAAFLESLEGTGPFGLSADDLEAARHLDTDRQTLYLAFGYCLALAAAGRRPETRDSGESRLGVLDWGGELGTYHEVAKRLMPGRRFDYHCVDLPAVTTLGRRLNPEVTFHDGPTWLDRSYDLVFSSSSLQYLPDWRETVRSLVGRTSGYLYITRMPFVERGPSFVALQRVPEYRTEYNGWVLNRHEFVGFIEGEGMRLLRTFVNQEGARIKGAPEPNVYMGFLFERAES